MKMVIADIDGVMTNGTKVYDDSGNCISKSYNDLDFTAIKRFKAMGIKVIFLSGDNRINESMSKKREIDFWYTPHHNKHELLPEIKEKYGIEYQDMVYVGDDIYDIKTMQLLNSYCPNTSPRIVKQYATTLDVAAGEGVIARLYDWLMPDFTSENVIAGL